MKKAHFFSFTYLDIQSLFTIMITKQTVQFVQFIRSCKLFVYSYMNIHFFPKAWKLDLAFTTNQWNSPLMQLESVWILSEKRFNGSDFSLSSFNEEQHYNSSPKRFIGTEEQQMASQQPYRIGKGCWVRLHDHVHTAKIDIFFLHIVNYC